ncbi:general secretion pathway protein K [Legionella beliardensis]|uniref:Type II secretion system protein K n=1 Tax=Legionella beliardensis TaxID=91822 RepID=A0A378I1J3_9GAMM|nr:type II secretion system minor pseudopilin GspK [Legionella beliardensis]STX29019.1 general secretion pathway protein K [Legionella beliardensis]
MQVNSKRGVFCFLQQGSALLSALFIMTLVAIAATAMSVRLQLDIYRTQLTIISDKLYLASQVVSFWAMGEILNTKNRFAIADKYGKVMDFPKQYEAIYPGFVISGSLYDLQGRFNLNNVSDRNYYPIFLKFLKNTLNKTPTQEQLNIAAATYQWLSPYTPGRGNDEFMTYYLKQKPAYYPSKQLFESVTEFRLVRGINAVIYRQLENFITALPAVTPININTASRQLLMSLGDKLNEQQINDIMTARGKDGIMTDKKLNALLKKLNLRKEIITIESEYFLSIAKIKSSDLTLVNFSILKRSKDKEGKMSVSLVKESLNTL